MITIINYMGVPSENKFGDFCIDIGRTDFCKLVEREPSEKYESLYYVGLYNYCDGIISPETIKEFDGNHTFLEVEEVIDSLPNHKTICIKIKDTGIKAKRYFEDGQLI